MADEVVIVECIEIDLEMVIQFEAQTNAADETRTKAGIFIREFAHFVEVVKIDVIICHPVGFTHSTFSQPIADITTAVRMSADNLSSKGEIGHNRQHQVIVVMVSENRFQIIEIPIHSVGAAHKAKISAKREPVGEAIARLNSGIKTAESRIGFVNAPCIGTRDGSVVPSTLDAQRPLCISHEHATAQGHRDTQFQ